MGLRSIEKLVEEQEPHKLHAFMLAQSRLLEMVATSAPLTAILEKLIEALEQQSEGMLCSILLVAHDHRHLTLGAAPSLPPGFSAAIADGVIGPQAGSCGTAIYRKQQVIVTDIANDPLWTDWKQPALSAGLRACWSTPIFKQGGKADAVLGSFAIYYRQPMGPSPLHLRLIEVATYLAGIAIERSQSEAERDDLLAKLAAEKGDLARCISARDEFIALASHELMTPLAVLRLKVETFMTAPNTPIGAHFEQPLSVLRQVMRLETLAGDLLEYIRINSGEIPIDKSFGDLTTIAQQVAYSARAGFEREGRQLRFQSYGPIPGQWDAARIGQVIDRLLANALRYGLHLPVEMDVRGDGARAFIEVRDSGIGIAHELQRVIFDRFERGVSWRNYGGLGLGLWISKRIVTALGGTVHVLSEPGKGATFVVELPTGTSGE